MNKSPFDFGDKTAYADKTSSHLTRSANNADQVIGYQDERLVGVIKSTFRPAH